MAEAVIEEPTDVPKRFFCHMCNIEVNIGEFDFKCPHCNNGFVEELTASSRIPLTSGGSGNATSGNSPGPRSNIGSVLAAGRLPDLDALRGEIATLLLSRNGPNVEISLDPTNRGSHGLVALGGQNGGGHAVGNSGENVANRAGSVNVRGPGNQNYDRLDNVLLEFLHSISGGDTEGPFANSQMFFVGNPGDYAWGREGIDTIVTQMLNQMETSGPPPLTKDKIASIPTVLVSDEETNRKLQCSVCWDHFQLEESVRKLPCSHIYHENCIVPWLMLHGTCPICRKSLIDEFTDSDIELNASAPDHQHYSIYRSIPNVTDNVNAGIERNTNPGGSRPTGGNTTSQSSRNTFKFDNSKVDLD